MEQFESKVPDPAEGERKVIHRVIAGAKNDFRELVLAHHEQIFAMIMRQVADRSAASDLTQEVFLRAYLHLPKFRFECKFSTWLTRIALNVTNTYFCSKAYKQFVATSELDSKLQQALHEIADTDCYDEGAIERLRRTVSRLKPVYRDVVVLCAFEHRPYEEAAQTLGVPVGTVRSRLNKARKLLRKLYFEE